MVRVMNDCEVIGFRKTQFSNASTGEVIYGYNVYFSYSPDGVEGVAAGQFYLSTKVFKDQHIDVGSPVSVAYTNKRYELVA